MANPISPFPKFAPIGGLPWAVTALLLPNGMASRMVIFPVNNLSESTEPHNLQLGNVVSIFSKKPSKNDDNNDPSLA